MHPFNFKVSLRIVHPEMDPNEISKVLGLRAKYSWKAHTQKKTPKGQPLEGLYDASYCSFDLENSNGIELSDFIKLCNIKFSSYKSFFNQIYSTGGELEYFIGWYSDENSGEIFDLELLEQLVELKIKLSFDFYGNLAGKEIR
jgi:hypothetical protein